MNLRDLKPTPQELLIAGVVTIAAGVIAVVVMSNRGNERSLAPTVAADLVTTPEPIATPEATRESTTGPLNTEEACNEYFEITSTPGMSDEQFWVRFSVLADRTINARLAAEIERIARAYEHSDEQIPLGDIPELCDF